MPQATIDPVVLAAMIVLRLRLRLRVRVACAFTGFFGDRAQPKGQQAASEDFSDIPTALGTPYTYWGIGCIDADTSRAAAQAARVAQDVPVNHAPDFAPVIQPTCDTGTQALVVAALAWLGT